MIGNRSPGLDEGSIGVFSQLITHAITTVHTCTYVAKHYHNTFKKFKKEVGITIISKETSSKLANYPATK